MKPYYSEVMAADVDAARIVFGRYSDNSPGVWYHMGDHVSRSAAEKAVGKMRAIDSRRPDRLKVWYRVRER